MMNNEQRITNIFRGMKIDELRRKQMTLNDIFPEIYVINLPSAVERWNKVSTLLTQKGITKFHKFPACVINGGKTVKDREEGCKESHIQIAKIAKERKLNRILVLEDDIEIRDEYENYLPQICSFITKFPWELFYLGCNYRCPPIPFAQNVVKVPIAYTTHAYAMNECIYDEIINIRKTPQNDEPKNQIDCLFSRVIQPRGLSFGVNPRLFSQETGFSSIQGKIVDYKALRD